MMPTDTRNRPQGSEGPANRDALSFTLTAEIHRHLRYQLATTESEATPEELLDAVSNAVRNVVLDRALITEARQGQSKRVAHVALGHDVGPQLGRNVLAMGLTHAVAAALHDLGLRLTDLTGLETEPSLGDGDPSRSTCSLLESLATLDLPTTAYGLRFDYGVFQQTILDGRQYEVPSPWDADHSPWLIRRSSEAVWVPVHGRVSSRPPGPGEPNTPWVDWQLLVGVPWDMPVVGHGGRTVQKLRLFEAQADIELDVTTFGQDDYPRALRERLGKASISKLLYPVEDVLDGQELRLLQEYFLCATAVRDVLRQHERRGLPIQDLRATHHFHLEGAAAAWTLAELQRALVDEYRLDWDEAWTLTRSVVTHQPTTAAVLHVPRALLATVLPRHLQILDVLHGRYATAGPLFIDDRFRPEQLARLAGQTEALSDARSPRRWLQVANAPLAYLITELIGPGWIRTPGHLGELLPLADRPDIQDRFLNARRANKIRLCSEVQRRTGHAPDPGALFILHAAPFRVARRQLLGILQVLGELTALLEGDSPVQPRTHLFAGKACSTDRLGKRVIALAHAVGRRIREEPAARGWLDLAFLPDLDARTLAMSTAAVDVTASLEVPGRGEGSAAVPAALNGSLVVASRGRTGTELERQLGTDAVRLFGPNPNTLRQVGAHRPDATLVRGVLDLLVDGSLGDWSDLRHHLQYRDPAFVLSDLHALGQTFGSLYADHPVSGARLALQSLGRMGSHTSDDVALHAARSLWQIHRC